MYRSEQNKIIRTIGHITRTLDAFTTILKSFQIECVVDIRSFPGSTMYTHFNKEALEVSLPDNNINYIHLKELGGRRKPLVFPEVTSFLQQQPPKITQIFRFQTITE